MMEKGRSIPTSDLYHISLLKAFMDVDPDELVKMDGDHGKMVTAIFHDADNLPTSLNDFRVCYGDKEIGFRDLKKIFILTKRNIFKIIDE